jgi:hypothetical protein
LVEYAHRMTLPNQKHPGRFLETSKRLWYYRAQ